MLVALPGEVFALILYFVLLDIPYGNLQKEYQSVSRICGWSFSANIWAAPWNWRNLALHDYFTIFRHNVKKQTYHGIENVFLPYNYFSRIPEWARIEFLSDQLIKLKKFPRKFIK